MVILHAKLAADAFRDHQCRVMLDSYPYRHWRCAQPANCAYWFDVITGPGWLLVRGDVGELLVQRTHDMIAWSRSAINSIGYFAEKVPREIETEVFCQDVAREWIREEMRQTREWTPDREERRRRYAILLDLRDALEYGEGEHAFYRAISESGICDGCDFPRLTNWASSFLWCRECVKWLLANMPSEPEYSI